MSITKKRINLHELGTVCSAFNFGKNKNPKKDETIISLVIKKKRSWVRENSPSMRAVIYKKWGVKTWRVRLGDMDKVHTAINRPEPKGHMFLSKCEGENCEGEREGET